MSGSQRAPHTGLTGNLWMKPQAWAFGATLGAALIAFAALIRLHLTGALLWSSVAIGSWALTRHWNRNAPVPFPYVLRWLLRLPRPSQSAGQLARILQPRSGERLLEIGPGIGTHALPIASALAPDGILDVLDVQPEMVEAVVRSARAAGIDNINGHVGDASRLPYPDGTFDGAYLIGVLGEVPDGDTALRELFRVLKPGARVIVGELFIDPDFVALAPLRARAERVGFVFRRRTGPRLAYLARFER